MKITNEFIIFLFAPLSPADMSRSFLFFVCKFSIYAKQYVAGNDIILEGVFRLDENVLYFITYFFSLRSRRNPRNNVR